MNFNPIFFQTLGATQSSNEMGKFQKLSGNSYLFSDIVKVCIDEKDTTSGVVINKKSVVSDDNLSASGENNTSDIQSSGSESYEIGNIGKSFSASSKSGAVTKNTNWKAFAEINNQSNSQKIYSGSKAQKSSKTSKDKTELKSDLTSDEALNFLEQFLVGYSGHGIGINGTTTQSASADEADGGKTGKTVISYDAKNNTITVKLNKSISANELLSGAGGLDSSTITAANASVLAQLTEIQQQINTALGISSEGTTAKEILGSALENNVKINVSVPQTSGETINILINKEDVVVNNTGQISAGSSGIVENTVTELTNTAAGELNSTEKNNTQTINNNDTNETPEPENSSATVAAENPVPEKLTTASEMIMPANESLIFKQDANNDGTVSDLVKKAGATAVSGNETTENKTQLQNGNSSVNDVATTLPGTDNGNVAAGEANKSVKENSQSVSVPQSKAAGNTSGTDSSSGTSVYSVVITRSKENTTASILQESLYNYQSLETTNQNSSEISSDYSVKVSGGGYLSDFNYLKEQASIIKEGFIAGSALKKAMLANKEAIAGNISTVPATEINTTGTQTAETSLVQPVLTDALSNTTASGDLANTIVDNSAPVTNTSQNKPSVSAEASNSENGNDGKIDSANNKAYADALQQTRGKSIISDSELYILNKAKIISIKSTAKTIIINATSKPDVANVKVLSADSDQTASIKTDAVKENAIGNSIIKADDSIVNENKEASVTTGNGIPDDKNIKNVNSEENSNAKTELNPSMNEAGRNVTDDGVAATNGETPVEIAVNQNKTELETVASSNETTGKDVATNKDAQTNNILPQKETNVLQTKQDDNSLITKTESNVQSGADTVKEESLNIKSANDSPQDILQLKNEQTEAAEPKNGEELKASQLKQEDNSTINKGETSTLSNTDAVKDESLSVNSASDNTQDILQVKDEQGKTVESQNSGELKLSVPKQEDNSAGNTQKITQAKNEQAETVASQNDEGTNTIRTKQDKNPVAAKDAAIGERNDTVKDEIAAGSNVKNYADIKEEPIINKVKPDTDTGGKNETVMADTTQQEITDSASETIKSGNDETLTDSMVNDHDSEAGNTLKTAAEKTVSDANNENQVVNIGSEERKAEPQKFNDDKTSTDNRSVAKNNESTEKANSNIADEYNNEYFNDNPEPATQTDKNNTNPFTNNGREDKINMPGRIRNEFVRNNEVKTESQEEIGNTVSVNEKNNETVNTESDGKRETKSDNKLDTVENTSAKKNDTSIKDSKTDDNKNRVEAADKKFEEDTKGSEDQSSDKRGNNDSVNTQQKTHDATRSEQQQNFQADFKTAAAETARAIKEQLPYEYSSHLENNYKTVKANEVIKEISGFISKGETKSITLKIDPESLGKVKIELDVTGKTVNARIEVENENVRQTVLHNMNNLKASLSQSGVQLSSVNVSLPGYDQKNQKQAQAKKKQYGSYREEETEESSVNNGTKRGYNTYEYVI